MRTTKDDLYRIIIDYNKENVKQTQKIANALESINDNNLLHSRVVDENTQAIKALVSSNSLYKQVLIMLITALIVLAGAEKALQFFRL